MPVQEKACLEIAARCGWKLAHTPWLEAFSGRKGRPIFDEIIAFLDANPGRVGFYIFRSIDRFTRAGSFTYERMKRELAMRGVQMIDSQGVIQPSRNTLEDVGFEYDWSRHNPSQITEIVLATTANAEITTILTRMIGQEIRLAQRGYQTRRAHDGFKNEKVYVEGKKRTIQVPDPERARFYVAMFELRAAGQFSDQEIVDRLNAMGYRSPLWRRWDVGHERIIGAGGGNPLTVKMLQKIVTHPIYCGVVCEKWTRNLPIKAAFSGLVSLEVWNAANRGKRFIRIAGDDVKLLYDFLPNRIGNVRSKNNPLFPFRRVIRCPVCRKPFLGSSSRSKSGKKVPYYHCTRGHDRVSVPKVTFEKAVRKYVKRLLFTPIVINALETLIIDAYRDWQAQTLVAASAVGHNTADLQAEKAATAAAFRAATSNVMRAILEDDVEKLEARIIAAENERDNLEVLERELQDYIREVKEVMEHPAKLLENPTDMQEQARLYNLVFAEPPTYDEMLSGTPKLTSFFAVSEKVKNTKSLMVNLRKLDWNTVVSEMQLWATAT